MPDPWIHTTIAGFVAMGRSQYAEAAGCWLTARDLVSGMPPSGARIAATQTNAGAALLILRRREDGERALAEAEQGWSSLRDAIATWDVPLSGRSSAFHFRLASRNVAALQDVERRRLARKCEAALAITRWNRLQARASASLATAATLAPLLSDVLGPRSAELRLLEGSESHRRSAAPDSPYAEKASELAATHDGRLASPEAPWRSLEVAVDLTVLLRPGLDLAAGPRATDNTSAF